MEVPEGTGAIWDAAGDAPFIAVRAPSTSSDAKSYESFLKLHAARKKVARVAIG
jgi:hypothetical protein